MGGLDILVVGSVAYDAVETPEGRRRSQLGGSATYFSVAASYFARVGLVAIVGTDFRQEDRDLLAGRGVDLSGLAVGQGATFRWSGLYQDDLNTAITRDTQLNVFAGFSPRLSPAHAGSPRLFLANIDPRLQLDVLGQMESRPRFAACDTMNLWIDTRRPELAELAGKVDAFLINEAEARELSGERALVDAARSLLDRGLRLVVVKRGEYGVAVFHRDFAFAAPAYPVARVFDPTGAGDSFAGGFMGYLAAVDDAGPEAVRRAAVVGSVMASFAVERFGLDRLREVAPREINARFEAFVDLTRFHPLGGGQGLPFAARQPSLARRR